jgi:hypothetical protein
MAIDINKEPLITLETATSYFPRRRAGRKVHKKTIRRYALHGCRGHRLEVLRLGSTLMTSLASIQRFLDAISTDLQPHAPKQAGTKSDAAVDAALRSRRMVD